MFFKHWFAIHILNLNHPDQSSHNIWMPEQKFQNLHSAVILQDQFFTKICSGFHITYMTSGMNAQFSDIYCSCGQTTYPSNFISADDLGHVLHIPLVFMFGMWNPRYIFHGTKLVRRILWREIRRTNLIPGNIPWNIPPCWRAFKSIMIAFGCPCLAWRQRETEAKSTSVFSAWGQCFLHHGWDKL
jgi:hypothetical protein